MTQLKYCTSFPLVGWASRPSSAGKMPTPQEKLLHHFSCVALLQDYRDFFRNQI
ncbi:hypothetical protein GXM_05430 [Nostoc sphaeroides CCNUC1]|uniref:Uncharacterized protein n=1 Tax=Nostoc sphaeroides CCNUC1 TaxID=2653204 RepID=A0A5P8W5D3_9NOSO|nr:hypothetical protein GXM_05430 [Nostoc sphaeroides CCNUC1]